MKPIYSVFLFSIVFSCKDNNKTDRTFFPPKVVEAKGHVVPPGSMAEPKVIPVNESKLTKILVGKPDVVATNTNIRPAGVPQSVLAGPPRMCTPGKDTFLLPTTVTVIDKPFVAGIPEIVIAKDPYSKEQNPQNFSAFKKLQGLKSQIVKCLLNDRAGNIWLGTGAGVTKYDGKYFTHFTVREGLVHNDVCAILEDKSGNLWFGTGGGGISRYDGKFFTSYTEKEGLSNNFVLAMLEDRGGNIWVGTNGGGLNKYDGSSFTHFTVKQGLSNNLVGSMCQDHSGDLWFGTGGGGVMKFDGKSFARFSTNEGLSSNEVLSILEDHSGDLWFGTYGGASKYDGKYFTHFTEKEGLSNNIIRKILEDRSGNLWFVTYGAGITKYDRGHGITAAVGQNVGSFTHFTDKEGLSNNFVISLLEDRSGCLWFGTRNGGLNKYGGNSFRYFTEQEGLIYNDVFSILKDRSGTMWFGTGGGGLSKYDGKSFMNFTGKQGLSDLHIKCILEDKSGNLWFGSGGGGACKYDGKYFTHFTNTEGLSSSDVWCISEDRSGNLWFGTGGGGVNKYNGKTFTHFTDKEGLSNNSVKCILEDRSGNLWFGTNGGGVSKYDPSASLKPGGKAFTHYTRQNGLSSDLVVSILEDRSGNLWFGTAGGGVNLYDGKSFTQINDKNGLSSNVISSMLQDHLGNIWFGTPFGLCKLTPANLIKLVDLTKSKRIAETAVFFKNYSYDEGFIGIGVNGGHTMCEDEAGTIWIGANEKLTVYNPGDSSETSDTTPPNIQLTKLELFNENIGWINFENRKDTSIILGNGVTIHDFYFDGVSKWYNLPEHLSLAHNNNYITFGFIGVTTGQPKKVMYRFKLEGLDKAWSAVTSRTEAPYGNLPHGSYMFKVKAMNSEGHWSKEYNYAFTIRPPWWKTWWFRMFIALVIVGSVVFYIKWRERKLRSEKEVLEQAVVARTAEVVKQKHVIEEKHKEITDSINYAERIQRSFLATRQLLNENLKDYFVLFQPKDVVSGDFYWASKLLNGNFVLVTADSTGHGVPGAIMSILNISSLEKALDQGALEPFEILNKTRATIIERLKKDGSAEGGKDGMDASLISFDFTNNKFTYAAGNNSVWVVRDNKLIELEPDKMPVGKHDKDGSSFTQRIFHLQKNDSVYSLTDGLPDQFGGPKGKKFMYKQLKELFVAIAPETMDVQKQKLVQAFNNWKGDLEQVDDVCIIGVRV